MPRSHIITGLPDNYGRGRIIGDYRRVALYGVDFLIKDKKRDKAELDDRHSTEEIIRLREELAEQIRSLKELKQMARTTDSTFGRPATNAREATQWLYFGYLAGIKQQNGAAMSAGGCRRSSTSISSATCARARSPRAQAQEIIDDFVIKLRLVRFLRAPEYNQLFSGDPVWATDVVGGMGDDGRTLVTKIDLPDAEYAVHARPGARAQHHHLLVDAAAGRLQAIRRQGRRSTRAPSSTRATTSCARSGATTARSPAACRRCGVGKQMQFFGARVNL